MMLLSIRLTGILILVSLLSTCKAQEISYVQGNESVEIQVNADLMKVDRLGNIYLVTRENELRKYDPQFKLVQSYTNDVLGELTVLDITNPLKIILFYPDYQLVISLDNSFAEIGRYDLQEFGFNDVQVVALSNDNHIWLYDPESFSLKKINEEGDLVVESYSLVSENLGEIMPSLLLERHNKVFLNVPDKGILEFDNFGQFSHVIPVTSAINFQFEAGGIIYFDGNDLYQYDPFFLESHQINMESDIISGAKSIRLTKEKVYILTKKGVIVENRKS